MVEGFGAFGKMPGLGDFFRFNTPPGFVEVWDQWLQEHILETRQALGEGWHDTYMSAPIWRFTLAAGLAGAHKVQGVLMPSVDRVGRLFPLTLMAPLDGDSTALADHFAARPVFTALEDIALDMLEDGHTRDGLQERLGAIRPPKPADTSPLRTFFGSMVMRRGDASAIAAELAGQRFHQPSVWSTEIDGHPQMLICEKLPGRDAALGLIDTTARIWTEATPL